MKKEALGVIPRVAQMKKEALGFVPWVAQRKRKLWENSQESPK
jgi:hypothetical protein